MPATEPDVLDGNAIGGLLLDVFGAEMTTATGRCGSCGTASVVAEQTVYLHAPGTVVRCPTCTAILMVFVRIEGRTCVDLSGLAELR
jgi:ribosomal protein S27E